MPYFPKSQIKPNLYTNGDEFSISSTRQPYKGFYYEISSGQKYTGKTPGDGLNQLLISISPFEPGNIDGDTENKNQILILNQLYENFPDTPDSNIIYSNSRNQNSSSTRSLPSPSITLPTPQDYENGKMVRYFAKKTNELRYLEISKQTYTDLNSRSSNIAWDLYEPVQIQWIISGFEKQQVNDYNTIIVRDIERKKKWNGFSKFLKEDYTKYYKNLSA
jgi:hypothetical protein